MLVSRAQALPKAGAKWLYSPNLIHEFTSLFSQNVIYTGLFGKAFPRKHTFVDISVFLWLGKQQPRFAQGQPTGYFQMKELDFKNLAEESFLTEARLCGHQCFSVVGQATAQIRPRTGSNEKT